jgi:hypothetical protein
MRRQAIFRNSLIVGYGCPGPYLTKFIAEKEISLIRQVSLMAIVGARIFISNEADL